MKTLSFRFPAPLNQTLALLCLCACACAYSVYTYRFLLRLELDNGPLPQTPWLYFYAMSGLCVGLLLFVAANVGIRSFARLELDEEGLQLTRFALRAEHRRLSIPWQSIESAGLREADSRRAMLVIDAGTQQLRFVLARARLSAATNTTKLQASPRPNTPTQHPLYLALAEHLGERLQPPR